MAVRVALDVVVAGHDEDAALHPDDVDLGPVEARQHRAGDHLVDRAERGLAAAEIEHAVERAEQRIQLVGAEQDGDPEFRLQRFRQRDHAALVAAGRG